MTDTVHRSARTRGVAIACVALVCGWSPAAQAQTIDADRPGLLFAGSVMPAGRAQIELAALEISRRAGQAGETALLNFPSVLRLGLGHAVELQVGHTLVNRLRTDAMGRSRYDVGLGDVSLGAKVARPGTSSSPGLVLVGSLGLPTGDAPFTNEDPALGLQTQASWSLGHGLSLGALAGYSRNIAEQADATGTLALSLGVSLAGSWAAYVETGYFPAFTGEPDTGHVGGGMTRVVGERLQLDAFVNRGVGRASVDWTVGAGVAIRF